MYARYGPLGQFALGCAVALGASALNVVIMCVVLAELAHTDPSVSTLLVAEAVALAGGLAGIAFARRPIVAFLGWGLAGRPDHDAGRIWREVVRLPRVTVTAASATILVPELVVVLVLVLPGGLDDPFAVPAMTAAAAGLVANAVFVAYATAIVLRPVTEDLAARLPAGHAPTQEGWSLERRLLAPIPGTAVFAGLLVIGATTGVEDPVTRTWVGVGVSLGTGVVALALFVMSVRSLLEPIAQLARATRRVRRGELHTQVPLLADDELGELTHDFNQMVVGLRERQVLQQAFGAYVHPDIADRIVRDGRLPGEQLDVTVLFADLRGFTSLAERSAPEETVAVLDAFFDTVCPVVADHGGVVNKLLGDGLLAVFGAPTPLADHADRGVEAARALVSAVWDRFDGELRVGVGLSSGAVIAGTIGGAGKLDYTLIGDPVNVASRVEQLTKVLAEPVLLTEDTARRLTRVTGLTSRGVHQLRGRGREVTLYGGTPGIALQPVHEPTR